MLSEAEALKYLAKINPLKKDGPFFRRLRLARIEPFIKDGSFDLLYALGASSYGARFTKQGSSVRCLYVSEEELTAKAECYRLKNLSTIELEQKATEPGCNYSVAARMEKVLDLTDGRHLNHLQIDPDEMTQEFRGAPPGTVFPSQVLGYLAFASGHFDGIKFFSAIRPGFVNYVIFRDRLKVDATIVTN